MNALFLSIKSGWPVLTAAALGLVTGVLLRPDRDPGSASTRRPDGNSLARLAKYSPLGRSHNLPQTEARLEALRKAGTPSQQIAAALAFAEITSVEEIRDLLENSHRFPSHSGEDVAIGTLLKRWLELDAAGAVEYCRQKQGQFLPQLITNRSQDHPAEATAWVKAMPQGQSQKNAWLGLCNAMGAHNPDKAWEMLAKTPGQIPNMSGWDMASNIKFIVRQNVEKALASLETMPPSLVAFAQKAIAEELMKSDPARAWEWALQQPKDIRILGAALGGALNYHPALVPDYINALPQEDLTGVVDALPYYAFPKDPAGFTSALLEDTRLTGEPRKLLFADLFQKSFYENPATADMMLNSKGILPGDPAITEPLDSFFARGSRTATAWLERLPEGPLRAAALEAQARSAPAEKDDRTGPESLVDAMKRNIYILPTDARLEHVTTAQLSEIMTAGLEQTNFYRQQELLVNLGAVNPSLAATWLEGTTIDSKTGPVAAQFSAQWAETDPTAAAAWVTKLPPGNLSVNAAANVALQFHRFAPDQATAWAAQLPPGPVQDAARRAMQGP